jgi:hypothetical protein
MSPNYERKLVLRFRDLVTEPGGTILEHRRVLQDRDTVWWGWWMRQYEESPRAVLGELRDRIDNHEEPEIYLLDSGEARLFSAVVADLRVGPPGESLVSPDISRTPGYYQRGRYPAWFLLAKIEEDSLKSHNWRFAEFPTNPDKNKEHVGQQVTSLEQVRETDATLWVMEESH